MITGVSCHAQMIEQLKMFDIAQKLTPVVLKQIEASLDHMPCVG